jgi:hypothetical protein
MTERITGLEHLKPFQPCFFWKIQPEPQTGPTAAELRLESRRAYQRQYEAQKRALERNAKRVNPENFSCASFVPNSTRAAR